MKGDFSRLRFNPSNNYVSVLQQQGRVSLDADANEQCFIDDYLRTRENIDVIGRWGGPEFDWGFHISVSNNNAIYIGRGRYYVEGILCDNDESESDRGLLPYAEQPFLVTTDSTSDKTLLNQLTAGHIDSIQVYLEVWQRLVTGIDDPCLLEPALGQADTTVRLQTVWRVVAEPAQTRKKLLATTPGSMIEVPRTCCSEMTDIVLPRSTGKMMVPQSLGSDDCSCEPTPPAGYRGLENQLYRVEVHQGGDETTATFKWSRENASIVVAVQSTNGNNVYVHSLGFDSNLGFNANDWVELTDDSDEFSQPPNQPGNLYQIDTVSPDKTYVTMKQPVSVGTQNARMRRWDQSGSSAGPNGIAVSVGTPIPLESGISVQFTQGTYVSGDYWLIPARTALGQIEWPPCGSDGDLCQPALHVEVYRAPLACLTYDKASEKVIPQDCRIKFPPLSDICASDVCYKPGCKDLEAATNVQEALDILCKETNGPCTIVPKPGVNWEAPIVALMGVRAAGTPPPDADICFPVGNFPLTKPLVIKGLGNLRISGGGPGTIIGGKGISAALIFSGCTSVQISDLYAYTGRVQTRAERSALGGSPATGATTNDYTPGGTLSFVNCPDVTVENVWLKCGYAWERNVSCLSVQNTISATTTTTNTTKASPGTGHVRIRHCNLSVGRFQDGILLVQVQRAEVEDNILNPYAPSTETFSQSIQDRNYRANAIRELIAETQFVKAAPPPAPAPAPAPAPKPAPAPSPAPAPKSKKAAVVVAKPLPPIKIHLNSTVTIGNRTINFRTNPLLKDFWPTYIAANGPKEVTTQRDLVVFVRNSALQFLLHSELRQGNSGILAVVALLQNADQTTMARGIAVVGEGVQECRILNNSIQNAAQGIAVGMSNHKLNPRTTESASTVTIAGNQIYVGLPPGAQFHGRNAIYVGNVDSLMIENNYAKLLATASQLKLAVSVVAISIYGHFGRRLIVRHNHLAGFSVGIVVEPLEPYPDERPLWLAADNMAEKAASIVEAPKIVIQTPNYS